jgi:hypothetical protein
MTSAKFSYGVFSATLMMLGAAAAQELPAGPDREVVSRECQTCHDLGMVFAASGLTREGWNGVIDEMAGYGLRVTPEQRRQILEYLATYLGPAAAAKASK